MAGSTITLGLLITASAGAAQGALQSLGQNIEQLKLRAQEASDAHQRLGDKLALAARQERPVEDLSAAYQRLGKTIEAARLNAERLAATQERIASHKAAISELWGQAMGVAGLAVSLGAPVRAAVSFETAMADVRKVVDGTEDDIARLGDTIKAMARDIPLAQEQLAALAASGGQLGVKLRDLPDFVRTTAQMAVAFDMSAEEAGDAMAKVANVYSIPIKDIGRLGDAINQISNESPAKASEIVRALSRVGGVSRAFGLSAEAAAALSGAIIAMGKPPEVAATGINAMLTKLMTADKQGRAFQDGLAAIGVSASALKEAIGKDAQGALLGFLKTLNALPKERRMGVLVDLFGLEYADDIAALAGALDVYVAQIDAVGRAQGSMVREFAARSATTANNWQLLKNSVSELAIEIGSVLLPAINSVLGALRPIVSTLADWARANPALVSGIAKLGAALLALKAGALLARAAYHGLAISLLSSIGRLQALRGAWLAASLAIQTKSLAPVLGNAAPAVAGLVARLRELANSGAPLKAVIWHIGQMGLQAKASALAIGGALKGALLTAGKAVLWLGRAVLTTPIGLALSAAALLVYKYWEPISDFFEGLWAGLKEGLSGIGDSVRAAFEPLMPLLKPVMPALSWLGDKIKEIGGWLAELIKPMEDAGGAAQSMGQRIGLAVGQAIKALMELPAKLLALPARMLEIGQQIVNGLIDGIKSRLAAAGEAVKSLGSTVVSGLKSLLGIRSPSRVFAELGGFVAEGFAGGIGQRLAEVKKAAAALSAAALVAAPGAQAVEPVAHVPALHATRPGANAPAPMQITFAPQITVTGSASPEAARQQVAQAVQMSFAEFERMMRRYEAERRRITP